jgi:putative tryptophan/tyrosine transport system substrate-binding protein
VKRREFIMLLGGAAAAWPLAARAQQSAVPVIGFLNGEPANLSEPIVRAFQQGLRDIGYIEGHSVAIEYRWAERQYDRLPALAIDLVRRQVAVIAAPGSTVAALAAKAATDKIPIVFATGTDPVEVGLVASLNRPGGNVTGVATLNVEVGPKRLELLRELFPAATSFALLINPTNSAAAEPVSRTVQAAARTLGINLHVLHASSEREFDAVFATATRLQAAGLVIGSDIFFNSQIDKIADLAVRHRLPVVYQLREFAAAGGLLSYGSSVIEGYRQCGAYTGRILKGERPADLPVQQTTKVELYINLKTAKTLGITIPLPLSGRADELIE